MGKIYEYHIVYYCLLRCQPGDSDGASRAIVHDYFKMPQSTLYSSIIDKNLNQGILQNLVLERITFSETNFDITLLNKNYIDNYQIFVRSIPHLSSYQLVVSPSNIPKSLSIKLLESLNSLNSPNIAQDIETFENEYNKEVTKQINESLPDASKISSDMDQLITIMNDNIDKVLLRNDRLDALVNKTNRLNNSGVNFKKKAVVLKRKMWIQKFKIRAIIFICLSIFIGSTALYITH